MQSVGELIRKSEDDFINGQTQMSKYVSWSMHDALERIEAYLNSKHITGPTDSLGRDKPFFNIVTAIVNIWFRATDLDRKNIKFTPTNNKSVVLAFVANVILQKWMDDNRFGVYLNDWGRSLARNGSAPTKFIKNSSGLHISVTPWSRLICDAVDFDANLKIEVLELTEAQLRARVQTNGYDQSQVDALCAALTERDTLDKRKKDNKSGYIKLYEAHGKFPLSLLTHNESDDTTFVQQMHIVSFVGKRTGRKVEYQDFTLYAGQEAEDPYMIAHLIKEEGRTLAIGAVESAFESQWMTNHSVKQIKDTLDLASKLIFQTADPAFAGQNVLDNLETGDILTHKLNLSLSKVDTSKSDIVSMQNFAVMWKNVSGEITATPDAMRGNTPVSGTPYSTTALMAQQSNSLFELMTENKGLAIEDMMRKFIIPYIKEKLNHKDEVVAILDQAGIQEIDNIYIPQEAIKRFNAKTKSALLNGDVPAPFNQQQATQDVQSQMAQQGDKRFFIPSDADDATWAEIFSDFEWDSIRVEVVNENFDKQMMLNTLNTVFQTIANNPMILQNPNAMALFSAILRETGAISPMQLSSTAILPPPAPRPNVRENIDFKDLPPEAQAQMLAKMGIQMAPPQQAQPAPPIQPVVGK